MREKYSANLRMHDTQTHSFVGRIYGVLKCAKPFHLLKLVPCQLRHRLPLKKLANFQQTDLFAANATHERNITFREGR